MQWGERSPSDENVGRAIAARIPYFVGTGGAVGLFAEVDHEVFGELHPAVFGVAVDLQ